jgi:hypothetical protein
VGEALYENLNSPWGAWARTQGLVIAPTADTLADDGAGNVTIPPLRIISPLTGSYILTSQQTFALSAWDAVVVDLPPTSVERATVAPRKVSWVDADRVFDNRDTLIIGVRVGTGNFQWRAGMGSSLPKYQDRRIDWRNPAFSTLPGNSYPMATALASFDFWHWEFKRDVDSYIAGVVKVPMLVDVAPAPKIGVALAANATTGTSRMTVNIKRIADGGSLAFASWDATATLDIAMPGTVNTAKVALLDVSSLVPVAGELLICQLVHAGSHINDTLAAETMLIEAWLEIKVK